MAEALQLLRLNEQLEIAELRKRFDADGRVQVRNVLEDASAQKLARLLTERTPWGLTWRAGNDGPHRIRAGQVNSLTPERMQDVSAKLNEAVSGSDFAFIYSHYPASDAVKQGVSVSPQHDQLVAELNHPSLLEFIRQVTGMDDIARCTAQVTHFGPGHFLSAHEDTDAFEGDNRLVAYVLNLTCTRWRPDWGGYLNFFDADGDLVQGYAPRFNCLNMFRVPQWHNVSFVTPACAGDRLSVTGWFRRDDKAKPSPLGD